MASSKYIYQLLSPIPPIYLLCGWGFGNLGLLTVDVEA